MFSCCKKSSDVLPRALSSRPRSNRWDERGRPTYGGQIVQSETTFGYIHAPRQQEEGGSSSSYAGSYLDQGGSSSSYGGSFELERRMSFANIEEARRSASDYNYRRTNSCRFGSENVSSQVARKSFQQQQFVSHSSKGPPEPKVDRQGYEKQCRECAVLGIQHYNDIALRNGDDTYELVDYGDSSGFLHHQLGFVFHSNFLAKPHNSPFPDTPNMLFFAEIWEKSEEDQPVVDCRLLGLEGTVSFGLSGCIVCKAIHHPPNGFSCGRRECYPGPPYR